MATAMRDKASAAVGYLKPHPTRNTYTLTSDAPNWVSDLVREAHGNMLPDDFRFRFIADALYALADTEDPDDIEPEPDVYSTDLLAWAGSNANRWAGYCDDALWELGKEAGGFTQLAAYGQLLEREEVLGLVRQFLETMTEPETEA